MARSDESPTHLGAWRHMLLAVASLACGPLRSPHAHPRLGGVGTSHGALRFGRFIHKKGVRAMESDTASSNSVKSRTEEQFKGW